MWHANMLCVNRMPSSSPFGMHGAAVSQVLSASCGIEAVWRDGLGGGGWLRGTGGCGAGLWVGDCFIYNNAAWRLNYCVGGEVTTMFHLDRPMYLLGYLASQSRVYLIDKARPHAAKPAPPGDTRIAFCSERALWLLYCLLVARVSALDAACRYSTCTRWLHVHASACSWSLSSSSRSSRGLWCPRLVTPRHGWVAVQEFGVVGYTLLLSVIEYKTLVLRGDMEAAADILPQIPQVWPRLAAVTHAPLTTGGGHRAAAGHLHPHVPARNHSPDALPAYRCILHGRSFAPFWPAC